MKAIGVIPARWGSTRFPGKSLAPICGRPMIAWVVERAAGARRLAEVLVATDDERIRAVVEALGFGAVMTRGDHPSGTDRIAEAVRGRDADVVVNIQGDEPLIDPGLVDRLVAEMAGGAWEMATAAAVIEDPAAVADPSVVKVVCNRHGQALYFSRSVIPFVRDGGFDRGGLYRRHIGLYAYRRDFLERMVAERPCRLERAEMLEQLRAMDMGARIRVLDWCGELAGVDTPEDVPRVERLMARRREQRAV